MKLLALFQELEEVASRLGLAVVLDRGNFKGGDCILEGEEMVVLNKATPLEQQARHLAEALGKRDLQGIYLKPAVRLFLDRYQDLERFDERTQTTQGS